MTHVSDRNQQAPPFGAPYLGGLTVNRIVKIARILTVNRHKGHIGQVNAVFFVYRTHLLRQIFRQLQALVRKNMGHAVLAHGNLDFHAGVIDLTQHLLDTANGLSIKRWRLSELNHDHLPKVGCSDRVLRYQYVLAIALVFWRDDENTRLV